MAIYYPALITGTPIKLSMEVAAFSGNLHKIYLVSTSGCTASGNLVTNSGAAGTTDWVDSNSDGLGNNWALSYSSAITVPTIVTGNGFTGNAQKITVATAYNLEGLEYGTTILQSGINHKVTFKYRSSIGIDIMVINNARSSWSQWKSFPANTGNATSADTGCAGVFLSGAGLGYISFGFYSTPTIGDWFEIDEIIVSHT